MEQTVPVDQDNVTYQPKQDCRKNNIDYRYDERNTTASITTEYYQLEREDTINKDVNALQHVSTPHGGAGVYLLPDNGRNSGSAINMRGVAAAVHIVNFEHNGNPE